MEKADKCAEHFSFNPAEPLKRVKEVRAAVRHILICYHSHQDGIACMSDEDIRLADERELLYIIHSVLNGERKACRINSAVMPDKLEREVVL